VSPCSTTSEGATPFETVLRDKVDARRGDHDVLFTAYTNSVREAYRRAHETGIDFVVANIIQPYPGTGTFRDAVAHGEFLPEALCPSDSDIAMD